VTHKLHILAIAAHPDDVELSCGGTLIKHANMGQAVGILDLTQGELGTRGTPEIRLREAQEAAKLMGIAARDNAKMADGFFRNDEAHQRALIPYIRHYQPDIVLTNSLNDRHPDHSRAARFVADTCFLAGLRMIETTWDGKPQEAWRPKRVFHFIQDRPLEAQFIVDISDTFHQKMAAVRCFASQFYNPESTEPMTILATTDFLDKIEQGDALMGKRIGARYGEGFVCENILGLAHLDNLLLPEMP
jgi:N-acetylglucosamine malate deacetylase 1